MLSTIFTYFDKIYLLKNPESRSLLSNIMQIRNYRKNQVIQQPNSRCKTLYFVTKGVARIYYFKDAKDITEHFAFDANIIIRAESLFTKRTTPKAIQALTDLTVVAIPAQELFCLFETNLEVERLFNKIFIQAYIQTTKRVESLQFQSATERYYELLTQTNLINQIPLKHIASYLGITQVSLSRIRASI